MWFFPFALTASLFGADLAGWSAGDPPRAEGISLVRGPDSEWSAEKTGATAAARIRPVQDYYRRAAFLARVDKSVTGPAWLSVGYLDEGYGVISVALGAARTGRRRAGQRDQWGIARLNSGQLRHAVFQVEMPAPGVPIHIYGVTLLTSLTLSDTAPPREEIPAAKPAVTLQNPPDLVLSSGADSSTPEGLPQALATMKQLLPLVKALGFNGVEAYVKWNFVERSPGVFDWSYYDAVVDEIERHGLKWFPLLVVGSAYTIPDWFHDSKEFTGYICLEHGIQVEIPTIFNDNQVKYVRRFLNEFGKHYGSRKSLLGIRLGPSANYGEAQYPASGNLGYRGRPLHTHLGYWAGDPDASVVFRNWVRGRYPVLADLNQAWKTQYSSYDEVKTFHPIHALSPRMRLDFANWYMDSMTEWCEKWATWAREAMPETSIYQSSGGWGAVEIGTDYIKHPKSMAKLHGGVRLTNENDSYVNNFCVTRPVASSARFYGAKVGSEPAGYGSVRGVMARLYNTIGNGAEHLFYYESNLYANDQAIDAWIRHAPLLDRRRKPAIDIAVYYPDTPNRLSDEVMRYLGASAFFPRAYAMRSVADYDFAGEQMILDGALDRYKALIFLSGMVTEKAVLDKIDQWVQAGGTAIFAVRVQGFNEGLATVEGDLGTWRRWQQGGTGKGRVLVFRGPTEPLHYFMEFIRNELIAMPSLRPETRSALRIQKPVETYWAVLEGGALTLMNYGDQPAQVRLGDDSAITIEPYSIWMSR